MSGPHLWPVRVYFEDTDAGGVAYHARYLHWAERARTEALRAMGLPHQEMITRHGVFLVVRRLEVEYFKPALLDESVVVETHIRRVTGVQVLLRQIVRREDAEVLAVLDVRLASVGQGAAKPVPLPEP
ncbi:MAG: YbgC/FadM family acyl-CoA thioesterase, partial [Alphaproteobacteria bacterium]